MGPAAALDRIVPELGGDKHKGQVCREPKQNNLCNHLFEVAGVENCCILLLRTMHTSVTHLTSTQQRTFGWLETLNIK